MQLKGKNKVAEELKAQLARALADYDNLRKRMDREKEIWTKFSSSMVLAKLLPVLDIIEAAQKHITDQGLAIGISEFKRILTEENLKEIKPKQGESFDSALFEAIESVTGGMTGKVAELVLPGWKLEPGQVLRYAKVKVYQGIDTNQEKRKDRVKSEIEK